MIDVIRVGRTAIIYVSGIKTWGCATNGVLAGLTYRVIALGAIGDQVFVAIFLLGLFIVAFGGAWGLFVNDIYFSSGHANVAMYSVATYGVGDTLVRGLIFCRVLCFFGTWEAISVDDHAFCVLYGALGLGVTRSLTQGGTLVDLYGHCGGLLQIGYCFDATSFGGLRGAASGCGIFGGGLPL